MTEILDQRDVRTALDAFAELPDWLAVVMAPGRVADSLRRAVPGLAGPDVRLVAAEVDRLRAKGEEWLVHCRIRLEEHGEASERVLVGRLLPPDADEPAADPGVPFGDPGWRCWLPDLRLLLQVEEADPGLPALPWLLDPASAADVLQRSLREAGHAVEVASCVPDVVRYKPGSRCTIVYHMTYRGAAGPDPLVAKTHQGDKGRTAWAAMRALWDRPVAGDGTLRLAEPIAYFPEDRVLVQGPVPEERTLKDLARDTLAEAWRTGSAESLGELRTMLAQTARGLAALHASGAEYGRLATYDEELAEVREVVGRLAGSVPHLRTAAEPLLDRLEAVHAAVPAEPPVSAHHDFRPAQVLLHEGRIGFIDFDGACRAEPALDLGRFRAKLRDIGMSAIPEDERGVTGGPRIEQHLRLLDELCEDFLAEYRRHAAVAADRVLLWETIDLLTAVLHAWTKVRVARLTPRLVLLRHAVDSARLLRSGPAGDADRRAATP